MVTHHEGELKITVVVYVPNSYLIGLDTLYPDPRVQGGSGTSAVHFGENFLKQKLQSTPNLVVVGHLFGPQIRIWKDLGPVCLWSHCASLLRRVYKI